MQICFPILKPTTNQFFFVFIMNHLQKPLNFFNFVADFLIEYKLFANRESALIKMKIISYLRKKKDFLM